MDVSLITKHTEYRTLVYARVYVAVFKLNVLFLSAHFDTVARWLTHPLKFQMNIPVELTSENQEALSIIRKTIT